MGHSSRAGSAPMTFRPGQSRRIGQPDNGQPYRGLSVSVRALSGGQRRTCPDLSGLSDLFTTRGLLPALPPAPGRLRAPAWHDPDARPRPGERCATCWGRWWWCEAELPHRGWRCACCIPTPSRLVGEAIET